MNSPEMMGGASGLPWVPCHGRESQVRSPHIPTLTTYTFKNHRFLYMIHTHRKITIMKPME
jgi:hypothetical protein